MNLSPIEKQTLKVLQANKPVTVEEVSKHSNLPADSVRRAVSWLKDKGLIEVKENPIELYFINKGKFSGSLPERKLIEALKKLNKKAGISELKALGVSESDIQVGMGTSKQRNWINITRNETENVLELTGVEEELLKGKYAFENILKKIAGKEHGLNANELMEESEKQNLLLAIKRGLIEKKQQNHVQIQINQQGLNEIQKIGTGEAVDEIVLLSIKDLKEKTWKKKSFREFNLEEPSAPIYAGKRQPYSGFLDSVKQKLVEIGFQEMPTSIIVPEFYHFDVLFQPQNHPARQWTDTYEVKLNKKGILPHDTIVNAVKTAHETGGKTGSKGWRYNWSREVAQKLIPAGHITAFTAKKLTEGVEIPGKYFAISKVFRPDVLDATHLNEFYQLEGFVLGNGLNLRNLLGMLKEFAIEFAGAEKVEFIPTYYPFTEPSVQLNAYHKELGWIELGGSGIFRPEMTQSLGIQVPVLAWGLGIDRLAMFKMKAKDIRQLFSDDLEWLRTASPAEI